MRNKIIPIAIIFLIACACYAFKYYSSTNQTKNLTLYGNVDIRDVILGYRVSGKIDKLNFDEGDRVQKGDILAVLDKEPLKREFAIKSAELSQAEAAFKGAEREYWRKKELLVKEAVSQKDLDDAEVALDEALAGKERGQAHVEQVALHIQDTELTAPENGMIIIRARERGAIVSEGEPVYTVSLEKPVWVRTYIDEPELGLVYSGQKVIVKTDTGNEYEGQIGFISPQAEFTPKTVETRELRTALVYRLRVIVQNPDTGLRQGMPVTVEIIRGEK